MPTAASFRHQLRRGTSIYCTDVGALGMRSFPQSPTIGCINFRELPLHHISILKFFANTLRNCYMRSQPHAH
jgi:hypothetical protein